MKRVTVSTKVPPEVVKRVNDLGFCVSDSLQVGLGLFLEMPQEQKWNLIIRNKYEKAALRAEAKLNAARNIRDKGGKENEL